MNVVLANGERVNVAGAMPEPTRDDVVAATEPTRAGVYAAHRLGSAQFPDDEPLDIAPYLEWAPPPMPREFAAADVAVAAKPLPPSPAAPKPRRVRKCASKPRPAKCPPAHDPIIKLALRLRLPVSDVREPLAGGRTEAELIEACA